ncbi:hypothetical protein OZX60_04885 [Streptococcaceae bacterium ESL0687]|nr:hypothetical protein OZX60_04885 [Streptococcaceae bacterium ESL0687]
MEINKKDLKKISKRFRLLASGVINAHHGEVDSKIKMFVEYIDNTPIISEYIQSVYVERPNLRNEIFETSQYYGYILDTGDTPEQEISSIYQILKVISEDDSVQTHILGRGYTSSRKYQDMVKEFGNRVFTPFVNMVEEYLSEISIDMGYDEENKFVINVSGGQAQVNISNDNSTLKATQNIQVNQSDIDECISELKANVEKELSDNVVIQGVIMDNIRLIESEREETQPKKQIIKTAINTIQVVLKGVPMAAAAAEAAQKLHGLIISLFN